MASDDSNKNRRIVVGGYTMAGAAIGYCGYKMTNSVEPILVCSILGLSMGMINQYRTKTSKMITKDGEDVMVTQGSGDSSFAKGLVGGILASRAVVPMMMLGTVVLAAFASGR